MSVQIFGLREFYSEKQKRNIKAEVWFDRGYRAPNVEDIFLNNTSHIEKIPPSERVNVYYTVADCLEEKGRKLLSQSHIPFDVDGIDVPDVDTDEHLITLAKIVCQAIGVKYEETAVVFSGNGLQFIIGTNRPIEHDDYFDQYREHYGAICGRIDLALQNAKLEGKSDRSVWSPARLMRMPGTWNEKPNKPRRLARILQLDMQRIDFDVETASGLPKLNPGDTIPDTVVRQFAAPDVKTILDECKFLAWGQTFPEQVSEPEWYAALSITARFPEGRKFSHKFSEGHPGYSYEETEQKVDQALSASTGPRTCKNIDAISGGRCAGCKHRGTHLVSPIMIKGPDHIETETTGFRVPGVDKNGKPKLGRADTTGLRKYFVREEKAIAIRKVGTVWAWNNQHYTNFSRLEIERYAQQKIQPEPTRFEKAEFYDAVQKMPDPKPEDFFTATTRGRVNFQNGVLDVRTGTFTPQSPDYGFRSVLSCDYSKDAVAPRFAKFIDEVTCKRPELAKIIQEFMGYIFANEDCRYQKALMLVGEGANGKSTLLDIIRSIAGDGACDMPVVDFKDEQAVALLEGKMVAFAEENGEDAFRHADTVKNMITGGSMRVKKPYELTYTIKNTAKLIMSCNRMPRLTDHSHGFFRRFILIPFDATFTAQTRDLGLKKTLEGELPGVMNWAMEGYQRLTRQGDFSSSDVSADLLEIYKRDVNPLELFLDEACDIVTDEGVATSSQEAFTMFQEWAEISGYRHNINRASFTRFIVPKIEKRLGIKLHETRIGDNRLRAIPHLRLLPFAGQVRA